MKLSDIVPALAMLLLAAVMVWDTVPMGLWDGFTPGPAFFPVIIAALASVLSVILLVRGIRGEGEEPEWPTPAMLRAVGSVYGALLAFFVLVPLIGMIPAIVLLLAFITLVVFRQPLKGGLIAVSVTTAFIYVIFVQWLALPLPKGMFGS